MIVLQVLGIIFLLIILVLAFFAWKIYRFSKKNTHTNLSLAMSVLPAMQIELEPSTAKDWKEVERLAFTQSELKKVGANHVGYYFVVNGYANIRVSIWNLKNQAVAVIYEAYSELDPNNVAFLFEVASQYKGGSLCVTSNQNAVYDSRPEQHKILFNESNSIIDHLKLLKQEWPKGMKAQPINDAKSFFMECHEDISEWAWRAEQIKSDKVRQVLTAVGVDVTEELIDDLVELGASHSIEVNVNRARRLIAQHSNMPVDQWEKIRDKLVFINEQMTLDHLVDAVYELVGELTDAQEQILDGFQTASDKLIDPIAAFHMLLQTLNLKVKRVSQLSKPVKTEVYLPL